jgi:hypothetical protein
MDSSWLAGSARNQEILLVDDGRNIWDIYTAIGAARNNEFVSAFLQVRVSRREAK